MKTVTSVTLFNDAVGMRMSVTYSEIDDTTGKVVTDNRRVDRVVTDRSMRDTINDIRDYAQAFVDALDE